jgi:seryl-tRNA synthetase
MLDIKFIKDNYNIIKEAVKNKKENIDIDKLIELDDRRIQLSKDVDTIRSEKNILSRSIKELNKDSDAFIRNINESKGLGENIKDLETKLRDIKDEIRKLSLWVPNIPHRSVPVGSASSNIIVKEWGGKREFDFVPKNHMELIKNNHLVDFERGSKIAGSHFPCYIGLGARLERALINFMLDYHTIKHNYTEMFPPFLNSKETLTGTGQLPKLEDDMYYIEKDGLFLNPTAEPPVTNFHRNDIIDEEILPIYYTAYTACFRREAGSYGKETKGLKRVHQFNKVELVKFTLPDDSYEEQEKLLGDAEDILKALNIPYKVMLLSTGDMTFASSKTYDIEAYAPGSKEYLEVSSISNFEDFQARRMNIKFRSNQDNKVHYVHTINGSGLATPRTFITIIENYQQRDGSIKIPEVLKPYMGGMEIIECI